MNELKVRDLWAADPFDDAFRTFLRPWVSRGVAQAPDIKVDLVESNGDYKDDRVIRSERQYGHASRSLWLDKPVDPSRSSAQYENGVLELTLPKKETSTAQRLTIT